MTPFRAARKVVTSVTSVGTGLFPSKEQLGSIPVAGRILKHPVMDSTLTYIASKTTHRGGKGAESKLITPEDVPYLKLNRKLIDQAITLANLSIEKEDLSKTMDDEAADDAFELYLAAIATLMHSLPIETCDPLRREAFQSQLRGFLDEHQFEVATSKSTATAVSAATAATKDNPDAANAKQRRRLRRRRHREYREQARSLIHHYSPAPPSSSAAAAPAIVDPIGSRRSSAPSSLPTPQSIPLAAQQATSKSSTAQSSHRRKRRHRRSRGGNQHSDDAPSLGDTIISTAIESAIRLKQSPIPDVLKTCFRASRVILSKVDEKFHLQEKAWQLSKQSIEKAIELDEQYAIHEVVTETFFATVTGLVKAGIAYKETPSYGSLRAAAASAPLIESKPAQGPALLLAPPSSVAADAGGSKVPRSQNPQAILPKKALPILSFPWRRHSVIEEKEETRSDGEDQNDDEEDDDEEEDGAGEGYNSEDSSSSCFTTSEDGDQVDESSSDSSDPPSHRGGRHHLRRVSAASPYTDQVLQRLDMLMALRGVASYIVGAK
ncbi:hypothetical protein BGZ96_008945 [Linnemannia gamsii]|uniref:Uncharacterized protein n=1 Tax=Linnemannia gamsii TaxID=64522 RepID=A0ABQ7KEQ3_9FUNG|nr:hypothetical protein BGZ96_008945 [Linnemannia gamsii]